VSSALDTLEGRYLPLVLQEAAGCRSMHPSSSKRTS